MTKHIETVEELIAFLKSKNPQAIVYVDTFPLNRGSFEWLIPVESESETTVIFNTQKYL